MPTKNKEKQLQKAEDDSNRILGLIANMAPPSPEQEIMDWAVCPVCGSRDARIEVYPQTVLAVCGDCDSTVAVDVPREPADI